VLSVLLQCVSAFNKVGHLLVAPCRCIQFMEQFPVLSSRYDLSGRAVWGVGLGRLDTGIAGSNPAHGMDICPRLFVACCPV
jgi:hypothetical protein